MLELMFSLSLIGILIIIAVPYYRVTQNNQKVSHMVTQINSLRTAAATWRGHNPTFDNMTWDGLRGQGLLSAEFGAIGSGNPRTPYQQEYILATGTTPRVYIELTTQLGQKPCRMLIARFVDAVGFEATRRQCETDAGEVTIRFYAP